MAQGEAGKILCHLHDNHSTVRGFVLADMFASLLKIYVRHCGVGAKTSQLFSQRETSITEAKSLSFRRKKLPK